MDMDRFYKVTLICFVVSYFLTGIYVVWDAKYLLALTISNLLIYGYLAIPFVASSVGVFSVFKGNSPTAYLWVCVIYWLFNTYETVIEVNTIRREDIFFVSMFVISTLCLLLLVVNKIRLKKSMGSG